MFGIRRAVCGTAVWLLQTSQSEKYRLLGMATPKSFVNPFVYSGPLEPAEMIDREAEAGELYRYLEGGHWVRLTGPRRYGKTTLLQRLLADAREAGFPTALVDLEDVNTLAGLVVRIERAYDQSLRGRLRRLVEELLRTWGLGVALGAGGFSVRLQANPSIDAETVLLRVLALPEELHRRTGSRSFIVFDEIQDLLRVPGADGILRSVIQHHRAAASYAFAGSAPGLVAQLFLDPKRPLLEQAVPLEVAPLPAQEAGSYIAERFERTGRDPGRALSPLLELARGHPQRTMLLAHELWRHTGPGGEADEGTWIAALESVTSMLGELLHATWHAWPRNEQKLALMLAHGAPSLYGQRTLQLVGLKKGSVAAALEGLLARGDVREEEGVQRLTDPLLEHWLAQRPLTG
jgi:hypothetical protein